MNTYANAIETHDWRTTQKQTCEKAIASIKPSELEHWTILPDGEWPYHVSPVIDTPVAELKSAGGGDELAVMIVGCIVYRSVFDETLYTTSFVARASEEDSSDTKHMETRGAINHLRLSHLSKPPPGWKVVIKDLSMAGEPPR